MNNETLTVCHRQADEQLEGLSPVPAALEINLEDFRAEIEELQISDEQAQELFGTLWEIMRSFVELGFRVNICEQIFENGVAIAEGATSDVQCPHSKAATENAPDGTEKEDS